MSAGKAEPRGYLSVRHVADLLDVSPSALYAEVAAGRLRAVKPRSWARGFLVPRDELDRWVREELAPVHGGQR